MIQQDLQIEASLTMASAPTVSPSFQNRNWNWNSCAGRGPNLNVCPLHYAANSHAATPVPFAIQICLPLQKYPNKAFSPLLVRNMWLEPNIRLVRNVRLVRSGYIFFSETQIRKASQIKERTKTANKKKRKNKKPNKRYLIYAESAAPMYVCVCICQK